VAIAAVVIVGAVAVIIRTAARTPSSSRREADLGCGKPRGRSMPDARPGGRAASRAEVVVASRVYVLWGSTYLAIRFGVETLPPFLMRGCAT